MIRQEMPGTAPAIRPVAARVAALLLAAATAGVHEGPVNTISTATFPVTLR